MSDKPQNPGGDDYARATRYETEITLSDGRKLQFFMPSGNEAFDTVRTYLDSVSTKPAEEVISSTYDFNMKIASMACGVSVEDLMSMGIDDTTAVVHAVLPITTKIVESMTGMKIDAPMPSKEEIARIRGQSSGVVIMDEVAAPKIYTSTKTYTHDVGLSAAFRQWRAESHCKYLHGYSLQIHMEFSAHKLDERNWVVDFGGLKSLKGILEDTFDHKLLVAEDDPELETFKELDKKGLCQLRILPSVGCEKFAEYIFEVAEQWLVDAGYGDRVQLKMVEVSEHGSNSARVEREYYG